MFKPFFIILFLVSGLFSEIFYLQKPYQTRVYDSNKKISLIVTAFIPKNNVSIKKRGSFHYDPDLNKSLQANNRCFYKSGFDRGHLIPDRWLDFNKSVLNTTYEFTNIVPETPRMNRVIIRKVEKEIDQLKCNMKWVEIRVIPSDKRIKPNCPVIPAELIYKVWCDNRLVTYHITMETDSK